MYEDIKYKPLSAWGYFWLELLFQIPLIGLVFLIVFSFSAKNINRRNFARAHFCALAVIIITAAAIFGLSFLIGFSDKLLLIFKNFPKIF